MQVKNIPGVPAQHLLLLFIQQPAFQAVQNAFALTDRVEVAPDLSALVSIVDSKDRRPDGIQFRVQLLWEYVDQCLHGIPTFIQVVGSDV